MLVQAPHHPAQAGQGRAHHKHAHKQAADAVPQRLDHLAVLHAGANQQTHLGARQRPGQHAKHQRAHGHGDQAVFFDTGFAQQQRTAQALGHGQGHLLRAPDDFDQLFANDHAAHGDQNLLEVLAIHGPHDEALKRQTHSTRYGHRHRHRRKHGEHIAPHLTALGVVAHRAQHRGGDKRPQGDEQPVAKVQHVHQAKHQREA